MWLKLFRSNYFGLVIVMIVFCLIFTVSVFSDWFVIAHEFQKYQSPSRNQEYYVEGELSDISLEQQTNLEAQGTSAIFPKRLCNNRASSGSELQAMVVTVNGKVEFACTSPDYASNQLRHLNSVTKSVLSLLVGIAIDKGFIRSVDEPIQTYLPDYAAQVEGVSIKQLLLMNSPVGNMPIYASNGEENGFSEHIDGYFAAPDPIAYVLSFGQAESGIEGFNYGEGPATLMGRVLANATGMSVIEFAQQNLFIPLEIKHFQWHLLADKTANTAGGLVLSIWDLQKIAELVLNKGQWQGKQLISERWLQESTSAHIATRSTWSEYGYYWWHHQFLLNGENIEAISARGFGGQYMLLFPQLQVSIVTNGDHAGFNDLGGVTIDEYIIKRYLPKLMAQ